MIEVRIITTKGCEGCRIMENIATHAANFINEDNNKKLVIVTTTDCLDESIRQFVNRYQVKDYPATFILKDNKVENRIFGTVSKQTMIDYIDNLL